MPRQQRTEPERPEVAGDLDDDREVLRPQSATPIHLPEHTDACQVVAHGDNDSLVATRALHDDKRLCRDCARAERRCQR